ncbi:MAG: S8 family serine peptidase [Verrucomicrobia bacterium]|nr:S8 family serine peptidase [Verrucomicrobiota bacterium]
MRCVQIWLTVAAISLLINNGFSATNSEPAGPLFQFREPIPRAYRFEAGQAVPQFRGAYKAEWIKAWPDHGSTNSIEFGSRIVLQLQRGEDLDRVLPDRPLQLARTIESNLFILQAADALTAAQQAAELAALPEVTASVPVARRRRSLHSPYAAAPNDPYFARQWHLENRNADGSPAGADLNVRAAWPLARGAGVVVAIGDDGFQVNHPDLAPNVIGTLHFNFTDGTTNVMQLAPNADHATAVAGLVAARGGNRMGVSGVAPRARLASFVIFDTFDNIASDEQLMDMFQYRSNLVSVQNHSWGNSGTDQLAASLLEQTAIRNAVTKGRNGKGVVIVRSGGNNRGNGGNVNDDGYPSDPQVIAVGAVRLDGRAARYSSPGASLLVAAPSGDPQSPGDSDPGFPNLFTTDRTGSEGYNSASFTNDLANYCFDATGFNGTSASAPQISGIAALILSANTNLTYRDVQQILIFSSRHIDLADPDIVTNGAGFRVSHNVGFGVPDAGQAVALARRWVNRPALTKVKARSSDMRVIPDDGLRLLLGGSGVPANLTSIRTQPSLGVHVDDATASVPLVDVGDATTAIPQDVVGKGVLIARAPNGASQDSANLFRSKIQRAADAGAAFAVVANNRDGDTLLQMGGTDFSPIPAVMIGQNAGDAVRALLATNADARAQLHLDTVNYSFTITNTLICEHVGVQVTSDHSSRGDLRITLVSPAGTRSVLQRLNSDTTPGPTGWTYYSTHHFYESSAGTWTVFFSDENPGNTGSVTQIELTIFGVPIKDADLDGLDDDWEQRYFGNLSAGPRDDPDGDGYSNMQEQILGTNPATAEIAFATDIAVWNTNYARLTWPAVTNRNYEVLGGGEAIAPLALRTNLPGRFPEVEWFTPLANLTNQFLRVRSVPPRF